MARKPSLNNSMVTTRIKFAVELNRKKAGVIIFWRWKALHNRPFTIRQFYKSRSYVALSHQFAEFLHTNSTAKKIHSFSKKFGNPEEHFYATMFMLPGAAGGFDQNIQYFNMESAFWILRNKTCHGKVVIVGVGDLPRVVQMAGQHFFHNKYFMDYDDIAMDCMEERIAQMNKLEYQQERN